MYTIEYLPVATQDLVSIVEYIQTKGNNPSSAEALGIAIFEAIGELANFPYMCPVYRPLRTLKKEYRKLVVASYAVFYQVEENEKRILITRILYTRRDFGANL